MKSIIAKHIANVKLSGDGLVISQEAKKAKLVDSNVIDATLGTFYYEGGVFKAHKVVKNVLNSLKDEDLYLYSSSDGTAEFRDSVINWIFQENIEAIKKEMTIKAVPTPGGTGAIALSVANSLDKGETLLIPCPCWGPYIGIGKSRGLEVERFFMFDGDKFNMKGFIASSEKIIAKQQKVVFIINDPCNNPTGYTMSNDEIEQMIDYMNSRPDIPFVMIYDCAYMDMAVEGMKETRKKLKLFTKANKNIVILITFSASKTFFVYGQRLGAQIIVAKDEQVVNQFYSAANYMARNTWSNCNKGMVNLVSTLAGDKKLISEYFVDLQEVLDQLDDRATRFISEAKEIGLKTYPYNGGFFITVPCQDPEKVYKKLIAVEKVYLLPVEDGIRIAICSLSVCEVKGLAKKISNVINN